jgi:hypothetical protein
LDVAGNPHISYQNDGIKYAHWVSDTWDIQPVDSVGEYPSLALDAAGNPHISYQNDGIKHAHWVSDTWNIQPVDNAGEHPSLALDVAGNPHIAYRDSTNGDLKYTHLVSSLSLDLQATPSDGLHNDDVLTFTLVFTVTDTNQLSDLWDPLSANVTYVTDSLTSTLTPPAVYSPTAHAVTWQGLLPADTTHTVQFQVTPSAAGTDLSQPILNTAWLTDTSNNRSVSSLVFVNPYHAYLPLVPQSPSPDLVLRLHLDEPVGATTFSDSSVYRNHGDCSGLACPTAGVTGTVNTALHFDGADDHLTLGNPASMDLTGEISIEAWVNFEATDGIRNIVAHGYTLSPDAEVFMRINNGQYEVGSWDGVSHKATYVVPPEDIGNWVYLVGTYDGVAALQERRRGQLSTRLARSGSRERELGHRRSRHRDRALFPGRD